MSNHFADASTVVGDDSREQDFVKPKYKETALPAGSSSGPSRVGKPFVNSIESGLEERPFFVRIGKDGLIAALQKLDQQLADVCVQKNSYITIPDYLSNQSGRVKVLSKKVTETTRLFLY